jgi:hypothetical protein
VLRVKAKEQLTWGYTRSLMKSKVDFCNELEGKWKLGPISC